MALDLASENPLVGSGAGSYNGTGSNIVQTPVPSGMRTASTSRRSPSSGLSGLPSSSDVRLPARPRGSVTSAAARSHRGRSARCVPGSRGHRLGLGVSASYARGLACASVIVAEAGEATARPARLRRVAALVTIAALVPSLRSVHSEVAQKQAQRTRSTNATSTDRRLRPGEPSCSNRGPLNRLCCLDGPRRQRAIGRRLGRRSSAPWHGARPLARVARARGRLARRGAGSGVARARTLNPLESSHRRPGRGP